MDRQLYSLRAHATCPFAAPVRAETFDAIVEALDLPPKARVLDLGCGKAQLSARIAERWGADCLGIDLNPYALAVATSRTLRCGSLAVREGDLSGPLPEGPWDLVVNIGAMPSGRQREAFAGWAEIAPKLLVGDGWWKRTPAPAYLEALGGTAADLRDRAGTEALPHDAGLRTIARWWSSDADFLAYETAYRDNVLAWIAEHPDDPDASTLRARAEGWWSVVQAHGRDTLGFYVALLAR